MIACGEDYTVIQNDKNEIYVCGYNYFGQLGLGDNDDRNIFEKIEKNFGEIKKIACGYSHTVIQNVKNEVYVCGFNEYGQLGLGDNKNRKKFEKVERNLGEIKNITCGRSHTVIQNEKNEIYVCGFNEYGQLGLGDNKDRNIFEKVEYNFGEIKNITCGGYNILIENEKNEIYVCGDNRCGQFGLNDVKCRNKFEKVGEKYGKVKKIVCGKFHTMIQNEKNEIYACGSNRSGQLSLGDNVRRYQFKKVEYDFGKIKNIACGGYYTVIQNEKNEIYVCGDNEEGQLGLGDNKHRYQFEKVEYDFGKIKNIVCGGYNTVVQNEKNEIYVCGNNGFGQLGLGDNYNRNIFEKVNTDDIFEKIYNFELMLNTEKIAL